MGSRKFLVQVCAFANDLRLSSYDGSSIFKNLEEVKKVIHARALMGRPIGVSARKTMGFDCIKLAFISHKS